MKPSEAQVLILLALAEERARLMGDDDETKRYCLADGRGKAIRRDIVFRLVANGCVEIRSGSVFAKEMFLVITPAGLAVVEDRL